MTPSEVQAQVRGQRLRLWAVTDHDTMAAYDELEPDPELITGVEVTTEYQGTEIHVVGLGVDRTDHIFQDFLASIRSLRVQRIQLLIDSVGHGLTLEDIQAYTRESMTRSHVAKVLVERGIAKRFADVWTHFIGADQCAALDLPPYPSIGEAVAAIRAAGGVSILAHPGQYGGLLFIEQLMQEGCDGLETNHPKLDPLLKDGLEILADKKGWLCSCGSDLHFPGSRKPGDRRLSRARLAPLLSKFGLRV